jgi:hypothetical protein
MRKGHLIERIAKIYDALNRRVEATATDLQKELNEPLGTVSTCLSYMVRTGYLYRNNNLYDIRLKADPREVALKIRKTILEDKAIRKQRALNRSRTLFDQPTPKKLIEEWMHEAPAKPEKIKAAINLLKNNGYKILKPTTEFKEI